VGGQRTSDVAQQLVIGVNPSGGTSRTIYTSTRSLAGSPSWMPDGSGFVFISNGMGQWNIVRSLSKSPNAAVSVVTRGDMAPSVDRPVVSPDGKRVAFQMTVSSTRYIGVSGIDGSSFTQLTEGFWPSWSPDGKQIVFVREVGQVQQVFLVNSATGDNLVQVTSDEAQNTNPSFSPDGRYIVCQSNRGWNKFPSGTAAATWNLFAIKPDGTQLTQLTDGAHDSGQPFWGSDGNIYFTSNESGNYDIWRLQTGGDLALEETSAPKK
jgi:TolB protein